MLVSKAHSFILDQIPEGATILIDKPREWTSFDVVNKLKFALKRKFQLPKVKIGHTGTLDPLATGLLMICVGKHTKKIQELTGMNKTYSGTLFLGATTPSFDAEQPIDQTFSTEHITQEHVENVFASFIGPQEQIPPNFSAKRVQGQKAYELARKGEMPELKKSSIHIYGFQLLSFDLPLVEFEVHSSKGTYIRSLARDVGQKLHSGAYLHTLRRDAIGDYLVKDAFLVEEFINLLTV